MHQMVEEDSDGTPVVPPRLTERSRKICENVGGRSADPSALPVHEVHMRVPLNDRGREVQVVVGECRDGAKANLGQLPCHDRFDPVPWRHIPGTGWLAEEIDEPPPGLRPFGKDDVEATLQRGLGLLASRQPMIDVTDAVHGDAEQRLRTNVQAQFRFRQHRHHRQQARGAMSTEPVDQTIESIARADGVVVTKPDIGRAPGRLPKIKLGPQIDVFVACSS